MLRTNQQPEATCPDGQDHHWLPGDAYLSAIYAEPVAYHCSRCLEAVGPRAVPSVRKAMRAKREVTPRGQ